MTQQFTCSNGLHFTHNYTQKLQLASWHQYTPALAHKPHMHPPLPPPLKSMCVRMCGGRTWHPIDMLFFRMRTHALPANIIIHMLTCAARCAGLCFFLFGMPPQHEQHMQINACRGTREYSSFAQRNAVPFWCVFVAPPPVGSLSTALHGING